MLNKILVFGIGVLVMNLFLSAPVFAEKEEEKALKLAERVRLNVAKLGTGPDARVEVKLKDGTKLKGFVGRTTENGFVVVNHKTGVATEAPYSQTKQVKGNNLSKGAKIAIGVGIILVVFFIIGAVQ